jgi:hypothetical protein
MRIDPDVIEASRPDDREIALLAAEVRRLQAVINSEEPAAIDEEQTALLAEIEKLDAAKKALFNIAKLHISQIGTLRKELLQARMQPALTDEERECLEWAEELAGNCEEFGRVATLRSLLERTK